MVRQALTHTSQIVIIGYFCAYQNIIIHVYRYGFGPFSYPWKFKKVIFFKNIKFWNSIFLADINYTFCLIMTPIIPSLSPLFDFLLPRNISGTDFGTGYGGTVCGFHTRPP